MITSLLGQQEFCETQPEQKIEHPTHLEIQALLLLHWIRGLMNVS